MYPEPGPPGQAAAGEAAAGASKEEIMKSSKLLGMMVAAAVSLSLATTGAMAQEGAKVKEQVKEKVKEHKEQVKEHVKEKQKDHGKAEKPAIGAPAPSFTLKDTTGKEHTLEGLIAGKNIVVLEWFNPDCPYIKKHHEVNTTFNDLHKRYADKGVVFVAINSGATGKQGAGLERNKKAVADYKMGYPVLMDESGVAGKSYAARTTPHCFIINKDGKLAYMGAIDDSTDPKKAGETNYVAKALDELLAGKPVTTADTKPYGCSVKYAD